jgi:hypothetical protein
VLSCCSIIHIEEVPQEEKGDRKMERVTIRMPKKAIGRKLQNIDEQGHFAQVRYSNKLINVYEVYRSIEEDYLWVTKDWMQTTSSKFVRLDDER